MNASEYMVHWRTKEIWNNLKLAYHQARFRTCAALAEGLRLIDVGCALGHSTRWLSSMKPDAEWHGLDFDADAVRDAKVLFPKLRFHYSPTVVEFASAFEKAFDSVVCSEVIEHVPDDAEFVRSLKRIARRRVVLTTPVRQVNDPGHLRLYNDADLRALCAPERCDITRDKMFYYVAIHIAETDA